MEKENQKIKGNENPLGYQKISSLLANFAIPSIVAMVVSSLYNVVDQIFIGRGVGYRGNAATNVAFPITTICMALTLTIGIGTAARYSLYLGKKQEENAAKTIGAGICMMITFGLLYALIIGIFHKPMLIAFGATDNILPYAVEYTSITAIGLPFLLVMNGMSNIARADGSPMYSMVSMLIGAVINTILDPIFIFVFNMGVGGAAWATVIGQIISCIYAVLYIRKLKRVKLKRKHLTLSFKEMGQTALMGMSNGMTQIAITLVQVVMNNLLVYYGAMSEYGADIPLAASGIVLKVNAIILSFIIGIVQGMQPIVGFNYGAKKYGRVKEVYKLAVISELVITVIGFFIFQLFPREVLSIFGSGEKEELYFEFAILFMRTFLLLLPLAGIQMISSNLFSAIGKPLRGALLSLTRQVFFLIPLMIILPQWMGLMGIMAAAPISDFISFITVMIFIIHEFRLMNQKENSIQTTRLAKPVSE